MSGFDAGWLALREGADHRSRCPSRAHDLAARFAGDFESAVLHAVNGGGQNLARAIGELKDIGFTVVGLDGEATESLERMPPSASVANSTRRQSGKSSRSYRSDAYPLTTTAPATSRSAPPMRR